MKDTTLRVGGALFNLTVFEQAGKMRVWLDCEDEGEHEEMVYWDGVQWRVEGISGGSSRLYDVTVLAARKILYTCPQRNWVLRKEVAGNLEAFWREREYYAREETKEKIR